MADFHPPFSERDNNEIIKIAHSTTDHWQQEAIDAAKRELIKRKVSKSEQEEVLEDWRIFQEALRIQEEERLEKNKTESYTILEMIVLFVFGPILIFKPYFLHRHTLFTLRGENYFLKFKQRIAIFTLSIVTWYYYGNYTFKKAEQKRLKEIEKIDISDWEKKYGYE